MSQLENNCRIDYIEFPATDISGTKKFYQQVFGWDFKDWGPNYVSFHDGRLAGGFTSEAKVAPHGGALVVLYASDLEGTYRKVKAAGGQILREIFDFPGGRRFHFSDPSGNELAVWCE
jgi:hypothetical protein